MTPPTRKRSNKRVWRTDGNAMSDFRTVFTGWVSHLSFCGFVFSLSA